ncbi:MAG: polysaccharide deacetylase family protein [Clostridia bacterium]|nr:polysaccharide deacetylase family protein [Clostridia bacterium]
MKIEIAKYYNNAKGAFSFVFDDGCYKDSTLDAYENLKEVYEKTGVKIKITSAQTVGFLHEGLIDMWKQLISEGYADICGHSIDHCLCYNDKTDPQLLHKDAKETKERLEEIYGMPIISYVTPGGGSNQAGWDILKEYYYANRNGNDRLNDTYNMNLYDIGTFTARFAYDAQPYIDNIDETIKNGGWCVQMNHWLSKKEQDTHHAQRYETFLPEIMYLAQQANKNNVWVCSLNDMVKYIYLRDNSQLVIENTEKGTEVTLKTNLPTDIFDHPVSLIIENSDTCVDIYPNQTVVL